MNYSTSQPSWLMNHALVIDRHLAGFCGGLLRTGAERRQVIAAYLAARPPAESEMKEVGQTLLSSGHSSILAAAHGGPTQGLRGALARTGATVHEKKYYTLLQQLLSRPAHSRIRTCIARLASPTFAQLRLMADLSPALCYANVVEALADHHGSGGLDIAMAVGLMVDRGVDEAELIAALRGVRSGKELSGVFRTYSLKCRAPLHPVPPSESYEPVQTGENLHSVAVRFRNCSRRFLYELLDHQHAFATVSHAGEEAVVHLRQEDDVWRLEGLFAARNERPSSGLRRYTQQYLQQHGIKVEDRQHRKESEWDCVRTLAGGMLFEFEFE